MGAGQPGEAGLLRRLVRQGARLKVGEEEVHRAGRRMQEGRPGCRRDTGTPGAWGQPHATSTEGVQLMAASLHPDEVGSVGRPFTSRSSGTGSSNPPAGGRTCATREAKMHEP